MDKLPKLLTGLGVSDVDILDENIRIQRENILLHAEQDDLVDMQFNLSIMLSDRFDSTAMVRDIDEAILLARAANRVTPDGDNDKIHCQRYLLRYLKDRYFKTETAPSTDIDEAIELSKILLESAPKDPDRILWQVNLGIYFQVRYSHTFEMGDLSEAISTSRAALDAMPMESPYRGLCHFNLGRFLNWWRKKTKLNDYIEEAVGHSRLAASSEMQFLDRDDVMSDLIDNLEICYEATDQIDFLNETIMLMRKERDTQKPAQLNRLAILLSDRFDMTSQEADLKEAIKVERAAIAIIDKEDPERASYHSSLAYFLEDIYELRHYMSDLDESIRWSSVALKAIKDDPTSRSEASAKLAHRLILRYRKTRDRKDFTRAANLYEFAVNNTTESHPKRNNWIQELSSAREARPSMVRTRRDMLQAVAMAKAGLDSDIDDSNPSALSRVACDLRDLYKETKSKEHLDEAIKFGQAAVDAISEEDQDRALFLIVAGSILRIRYNLTKSESDRVIIFRHFEEAINSNWSFPRYRQSAARHAASLSIELQDWSQASEYLKKAIKLYPTLVDGCTTYVDMEHVLRDSNGLGSLAASVYVKTHKSRLACLKILESCRGIVFRRMLIPDLSSLRHEHPGLCLKYEEHLYPTAEMDRLESGRKLLVLKQQIRGLPGFERFGTEGDNFKSKAEILALAHAGPVVIFNIDYVGSNAFIVTEKDITIFPLTELKDKDLSRHASSVYDQGSNPRDLKLWSTGASEPKQQQNRKYTMAESSAWLWDVAVKPVLGELGLLWKELPPRKLPRLTWISGGKMRRLPIHAAGYYEKGSNDNVMSHVISSYSTTLKALQICQKAAATNSTKAPIEKKILVVTMAETKGQDSLNVEDEISAIHNYAGSVASVDVLPNPTVKTVLENIPSHTIVHFACHASSRGGEPFMSALLLGKDSLEKLTVNALTRLSFQTAELAYLSACSTAGSLRKKNMDESIHMANEFQILGFPQVIATLWSANDAAAVFVATKFYRFLAYNERTGEDSPVARALHSAVLELRNEKLIRSEIMHWAPFVHIGA